MAAHAMGLRIDIEFSQFTESGFYPGPGREFFSVSPCLFFHEMLKLIVMPYQ
jgi:hypothetical protein